MLFLPKSFSKCERTLTTTGGATGRKSGTKSQGRPRNVGGMSGIFYEEGGKKLIKGTSAARRVR